MISREAFTKALADYVSISVEDLNATEMSLISKAYLIVKDCLAEQKALSDEVKRLSIDLANLRAMTDDRDEGYEEES